MKLTPMIPEGKRKPDGFMLSLTTEEAHQLIASLANQLADESANSGRVESYTEDGLYFSVAVDFQKEWKEQKLKMDAYHKILKEKVESEKWSEAHDIVYEDKEEQVDTKNNKRRKRSKAKV